MATMTQEQIEAARARCDAATPGPWFDVHADDHMFMNTYFVATENIDEDPELINEKIVAVTLYQANRIACHDAGKWEEDAIFIAHARTDLPAALDHIAEQQAVIHWLATVLANMECGIPLSEQAPELTAGMSPPCPEEIIKVAEESVASSSGKETPAHTFIDRKCPSCDGHGCDACQGGGLVGSYEAVPDIHLPDPSPWADAVRRFRESSGLSIREMGERVGLTPSQWSEIERGLRQPTDEQRASIDAMMHN